MQFTKLKLAGFKSFVDPTEMEIQPGITGVVGPNGCGKSNLVEALKWVMGETSAKQMRGSEMDDVIFSGSANRPARNIAEVSLALDNTDRNAPAQFNDTEDLEVLRKIVREKGSSYRVNAREVRARDVHLLFADAASGARSTALVSQGQIGEVVQAKPTNRRKLLEEAAGISGLHSRRHEAELRLRGAETNLERLDDIMVTLEAQMQSLRKQVRQATRYRNLNDHIRKAEATLFLIHWTAAESELEKTRQVLADTEKIVAETTGTTANASSEQAAAASGLPTMRGTEAEAAAALQRLTLARERLEEEEERLDQARRDCETRLSHTIQDMERERTLAADAEAAIARLGKEQSEITTREQGQETAITEASKSLSVARTETEEAENGLNDLTGKLAAQEASRNDLARRKAELTARIDRLSKSKSAIADEIGTLEENVKERAAITAAEEQLAGAGENLSAARKRTEEAEKLRVDTARHLTEIQSESQTAIADTAKMEAEVWALTELLETGDPDLWPPLIDAVTVEPGLEGALGTALGDDLSAATDEAAPVHWRNVPQGSDAPGLPASAEPLSQFVKGPSALTGRLSQIGLVADDETGWRLLPQLKQGQRLVSRDGAFWRWDGFTTAAEAPTAAAIRLEQRNRLERTREKLETARKTAKEAEQNIETAREATQNATGEEAQARETVRAYEAAFEAAREAMDELRHLTVQNDSKLSAQRDNAGRIETDLNESRQSLQKAEEILAGLPDAEVGRREAENLRDQVVEKRSRLVEAQSAYDNLSRQADERRRRLAAIDQELASWSQRQQSAADQLEQLAARRTSLGAERENLTARPDEIKQRRKVLLDRIEQAEEKRKGIADQLAEAETRLADADRNLRKSESKLASIREQRIRADAAVEQAKQAAEALMDRMTDRLNCGPENLRDISALKEDAPMPELEAAEKRVERLIHERENMGPVNLRAETEAQELAEQVDTLISEREDLLKAIDKLRRGINDLNREGRQRLLVSFEEVDKHFQELFVRLFGGGRAHLEFVESDDPLEAGLEIMASPPGKRLQVLSLLSGGEQALTALSLLFAVFLTNPAPICVLDEVDAPLDDANVDRFCSMVDEMAHSLRTRFIVVTHHRMTMARMNRLFGVTMGEQGVSQLVSVDLGQAIELHDIA